MHPKPQSGAVAAKFGVGGEDNCASLKATMVLVVRSYHSRSHDTWYCDEKAGDCSGCSYHTIAITNLSPLEEYFGKLAYS